MKYDDLAKAVSATTGVSQTDVKAVLGAASSAIVESAGNGDSTRLPDLGTFKPTVRAARPGRNPRTGEPLQIAEKTALTFKAKKGLME